MASSFHIAQEADKAQLRKNKIRKPVIEKMRRDRINHSIEQLRELLEKDIQSQHQHSKLEKADILEMAVKYLQQQKLHQNETLENKSTIQMLSLLGSGPQHCKAKMLSTYGLMHERCGGDSQDLYYQGYYMCLKETVGFLHSHGQTQGKILRHICRQQSRSLVEHSLPYPTSSPERSPCNPSEGHRNIWRPW